MTKTSLIVPVLAVAALIAGCGGGGYGESSTKPAAAKSAETASKGLTMTVEMTGSTFEPEAVNVGVGDTVRFINKDEIAHTATAEGTFDSGTMETGATFEFTAEKIGAFRYVCSFHPSMTGTINVI